MRVLPNIEVANLYAVERDLHREVIGRVLVILATLLCIFFRRLDDATDAFQNRVDQLHVQTRGEEGRERVGEHIFVFFAL